MIYKSRLRHKKLISTKKKPNYRRLQSNWLQSKPINRRKRMNSKKLIKGKKNRLHRRIKMKRHNTSISMDKQCSLIPHLRERSIRIAILMPHSSKRRIRVTCLMPHSRKSRIRVASLLPHSSKSRIRVASYKPNFLKSRIRIARMRSCCDSSATPSIVRISTPVIQTSLFKELRTTHNLCFTK